MMAEEAEYHDHICIRWKVNSGLDFISRESPSFWFRNSVLTLRLIKPTETSSLVMLIKSKPVLCGVYETEIYLSDRNGSKVQRDTKYLMFDSLFYVEVWRTDRRQISLNIEDLQSNGMLNFVCIVNCSTSRCQEHKKTLNAAQTTDISLEELSSDILRLYNTAEATDVSLRCGDRTITAHKILLSARSEVFAAMFRNDMVECRDGVINIQDMEFQILEHLLRYLYSGKMDKISTDTAMPLYKAADKYAVDSLKQKCASILSDGLTEENACDVLLLADFHCDQDLKKTVTSFLQGKEGFLLSTQWNLFSKTNPALAVEVYDAFVRHVSHK